MAVMLVRDETPSGHVYQELRLDLPDERVTARKLIRARVRQEVQDWNRRQHERTFRGLVQPADAERVLNGTRPEYRLKTHRSIDWEEQYARAVEAFGRNGFIVLIDDQQAESAEARHARVCDDGSWRDPGAYSWPSASS